MTPVTDRAEALATIDRQTGAGQAADTAAALSALIDADPSDPAPYHLAFKALSVAVVDRDPADLPQDDWKPLIRKLILQEQCDERPRIIQHGVASLLTTDNADTARRIATACMPTVAPMIRDGAPSPLVLFLMIARSVLPPTGPEQTDITRLHLERFREFSTADLYLAYSVKFNKPHFGPNRDDLLGHYDSPAACLDLSQGLGLRHLLLLDRLGAGPLFGSEPTATTLQTALADRLAPTDEEPDSDPHRDDELAAARVLIMRYAGTDSSLTGEGLTAIGLQPDLLQHHATLPQPTDRPSATGSDLGGRRQQAVRAGLNLVRAVVSPLARIGRRPRVALCVSGQLRGFRSALASWQRSMLPFADFDIYIHTWASIGRSDPAPWRAFLPFDGDRFCAEWRRVGTLLGVEEMQARYPQLFDTLVQTAQIDEATLTSLYGAAEVVIDDDGDARFASFSNQDKMHYKIAAAHELATASGQDYDLIMRIRPDLELRVAGFFWEHVLRACTEAPVIYGDGGYGVHYHSLMIGDQIAVGAPDVMDVYARTWHTYKATAAFGLDGFPPNLAGHASLAQTCWLASIDVKKLPMKMGGLLEVDALPATVTLEALRADTADRSDVHDAALVEAIQADIAS